MTQKQINSINAIIEALCTFQELCVRANIDIKITALEVNVRDMPRLKHDAGYEQMIYVDTMYNETNPGGMTIMGIPVKQVQ